MFLIMVNDTHTRRRRMFSILILISMFFTTVPKSSTRGVGRTNVTEDRRQTDRQTEGRCHKPNVT